MSTNERSVHSIELTAVTKTYVTPAGGFTALDQVTLGLDAGEVIAVIAVMKTIGATSRQITGLVMGEALAIALLSWVAALAFSVPLTALVGKAVGTLAFRLRLPAVVDMPAALLWSAMVVAIGIVASLVPARRASALTVREALEHV